MSAIIQAQIDAINNNKFLSASDKAKQISALQAQLKTAPPANVSGQNNINAQQVFADQQALTKILGARVTQITSTPQFVDAKANGASLADLNAQLTKQGAFITTPELNAFNQLIQNQPLTPQQQKDAGTLLSRLNSPVLSSGSTSSQDLYNFLQKSGALNPNPTINTTTAPPLPVPTIPSIPNTPQIPSTPQTPITPNPPSNPIIPIPNPSGGSSGGGSSSSSTQNPVTLPNIPIITDLGNFLNSLLKTSVDPTLLGFISLMLIALIGWYFLKGGVKVPALTKTYTKPKEKIEMLA